MKDISDLTGFPEMLDGRVKTLHPKVHGGILHVRDNPQHRAAVSEHGIQPIDMVVVNLYAFEKTAVPAWRGVRATSSRTSTSAGPSMVRSAAKNFQDVAIVTSPSDYDDIAKEMYAHRRIAVADDQVASGAKGVCHHGRLRFGDCVNPGGHRRPREDGEVRA